MARSQRWECNEVAIWEMERVVSREGGMEFKNKIVIAPGKRSVSRDSLQGFHNSYIMFWIIEVTWMTVA